MNAYWMLVTTIVGLTVGFLLGRTYSELARARAAARRSWKSRKSHR